MIGGNLQALFQSYSSIRNEYGEDEKTWSDLLTLTGFLDAMGGDSNTRSYDTKLQESSHVFITDYTPEYELLSSRRCRAIINGKIYEVSRIDNPMELNAHLEIFLKYLGE